MEIGKDGVKIIIPEWNYSILMLQVEDEKGKGRTSIGYKHGSILVLSEKIGITPSKILIHHDNCILWMSSYGVMQTDGKVMKRNKKVEKLLRKQPKATGENPD